jgi:hypothetical protein
LYSSPPFLLLIKSSQHTNGLSIFIQNTTYARIVIKRPCPLFNTSAT